MGLEAKDVIQLLRHQRHDVMNHLQIIQGYLQMGKTKRVEEKINDVVNNFSNERALMNLNIDEFALWLIRFNTINKNIRLTYDIHINPKDLSSIEQDLLNYGQQFEDIIVTYGKQDELYIGHVELSETENKEELIVNVSVDGQFSNQLINKLKNQLKQVRKLDNSIISSIRIPLKNRGE